MGGCDGLKTIYINYNISSARFLNMKINKNKITSLVQQMALIIDINLYSLKL